MMIRGWKGALMYWLHIAASTMWLIAALQLVYILFKYVKWAGAIAQ